MANSADSAGVRPPHAEASEDLRRTLRFADGFAFVVLACPGRLEALRIEREARRETRRRGLAWKTLRANDRATIEGLGAAIRKTSEAAGAPSRDGVLWIEARFRPGEPLAVVWDEALRRLNETRNDRMREFPWKWVLSTTPEAVPLIVRAAPDWWSVRTEALKVEGATPPDVPEIAQPPEVAAYLSSRVGPSPPVVIPSAEALEAIAKEWSGVVRSVGRADPVVLSMAITFLDRGNPVEALAALAFTARGERGDGSSSTDAQGDRTAHVLCAGAEAFRMLGLLPQALAAVEGAQKALVAVTVDSTPPNLLAHAEVHRAHAAILYDMGDKEGALRHASFALNVEVEEFPEWGHGLIVEERESLRAASDRLFISGLLLELGRPQEALDQASAVIRNAAQGTGSRLPEDDDHVALAYAAAARAHRRLGDHAGVGAALRESLRFGLRRSRERTAQDLEGLRAAIRSFDAYVKWGFVGPDDELRAALARIVDETTDGAGPTKAREGPGAE